MDTELLKCIAYDNGWEQADPQPDKNYIRFKKGTSIIDVWYTTTARKIVKGRCSYSYNNTRESITKLFETL